MCPATSVSLGLSASWRVRIVHSVAKKQLAGGAACRMKLPWGSKQMHTKGGHHCQVNNHYHAQCPQLCLVKHLPEELAAPKLEWFLLEPNHPNAGKQAKHLTEFLAARFTEPPMPCFRPWTPLANCSCRSQWALLKWHENSCERSCHSDMSDMSLDESNLWKELQCHSNDSTHLKSAGAHARHATKVWQHVSVLRGKFAALAIQAFGAFCVQNAFWGVVTNPNG